MHVFLTVFFTQVLLEPTSGSTEMKQGGIRREHKWLSFCSWYPEKQVQRVGNAWTPAGSQDKTSRWDGGLGGSSSKALVCFSGGKLWSVLPLPASTNANNQSPLQCWRTVSVFFYGFAVVYFCINLFCLIHRHVSFKRLSYSAVVS